MDDDGHGTETATTNSVAFTEFMTNDKTSIAEDATVAVDGIHDAPRTARPYDSITSEATTGEIRALHGVALFEHLRGNECSNKTVISSSVVADGGLVYDCDVAMQTTCGGLVGVDASVQAPPQWVCSMNSSAQVDADANMSGRIDEALDIAFKQFAGCVLPTDPAICAAKHDCSVIVPALVQSSLSTASRSSLHAVDDAVATLCAHPRQSLLTKPRSVMQSGMQSDREAVHFEHVVAQATTLAAFFEGTLAAPAEVVAAGTSKGEEGPGRRLAAFLRRVQRVVEDALCENDSCVSPFTIGYALSRTAVLGYGTENAQECEDDSGNGEYLAAKGRGRAGDSTSQGSSTLHEERALSDIATQQAAIVCVAWRPAGAAGICTTEAASKASDWLAVAPIMRGGLEARLAADPRASVVLLFHTASFDARAQLDVPAEVVSLCWSPYPAASPMLAAGLITGHVAVFDVSQVLETADLGHGFNRLSNDNTSEFPIKYDGAIASPSTRPRLQPLFVSHPDGCHARSIVALCWLAPNTHITVRATLVDEHRSETGTLEQPQQVSYQFASVGGDGVLCVWDTRFRERANARRRSSSAVAAKSDNTDATAVPWLPTYRVSLAGPTACAAFSTGNAAEPLIIGLDDGRIIAIDWAPSREGTFRNGWGSALSAPPLQLCDMSGGGIASDDGGVPASRILWVISAADSVRPPVAIMRSPWGTLPPSSPLAVALGDVIVVVTERDASLFRRGNVQELLTLPPTAPSVSLTAAAWSPTRSAVLFFGRSDGMLEAWDLLESTARPVLAVQLVSAAITSIEFQSSSAMRIGNVEVEVSSAPGMDAKRQRLAVGDARGVLHILRVPVALRRYGASGKGSSDDATATVDHGALTPRRHQDQSYPDRHASHNEILGSSEDARFAALLQREAIRAQHLAVRMSAYEAESAAVTAALAKAAAACNAVEPSDNHSNNVGGQHVVTTADGRRHLQAIINASADDDNDDSTSRNDGIDNAQRRVRARVAADAYLTLMRQDELEAATMKEKANSCDVQRSA